MVCMSTVTLSELVGGPTLLPQFSVHFDLAVSLCKGFTHTLNCDKLVELHTFLVAYLLPQLNLKKNLQRLPEFVKMNNSKTISELVNFTFFDFVQILMFSCNFRK